MPDRNPTPTYIYTRRNLSTSVWILLKFQNWSPLLINDYTIDAVKGPVFWTCSTIIRNYGPTAYCCCWPWHVCCGWRPPPPPCWGRGGRRPGSPADPGSCLSSPEHHHHSSGFWFPFKQKSYLKEQCNKIFRFRFLFMNHLLSNPGNNIRVISNFLENLRRYLQVKVHHWY